MFFINRHTFIDTVRCLRTLRLSGRKYHLPEWPRTWKLSSVLLSDHIPARSKRMPQGAWVYGYPTCPSPITCDFTTPGTGGTRTIHTNPTYCTTIIGYGKLSQERTRPGIERTFPG